MLLKKMHLVAFKCNLLRELTIQGRLEIVKIYDLKLLSLLSLMIIIETKNPHKIWGFFVSIFYCVVVEGFFSGEMLSEGF